MTTKKEQEKAKPVHTERMGDIKGNVWKNTGEKGTFYNVSFTRTAKMADNKFKDMNSFRVSDMKLQRLLSESLEKWIETHPA
ncbi:MAG: hypothetical protein AB7S78_14225 [Candidatus Omnitrophota bacterium]